MVFLRFTQWAHLLDRMYQVTGGAAGWQQSSWLTTDLKWRSFYSVSIFPRLGSLWSLILMLKFFWFYSCCSEFWQTCTHTHTFLNSVTTERIVLRRLGTSSWNIKEALLIVVFLLYCIPVYFIQAKFRNIGVENLFK